MRKTFVLVLTLVMVLGLLPPRVSAARESDLPDGYLAVEHLNSSGGAYIDTGLAAGANDKMVLYAAAIKDSSHSLFGSGSNNASSDRVQVHYAQYAGYSLRFFGASSGSLNLPLNEMATFILDLQQGAGYVNGEIVLQQPARVLPTGNTIYLFAKNVSGKIDPNYTDETRIYGYKHYRDGQLLRDMVPCRQEASGEYGMYDLVDGKFYTNAGSGYLFYEALDLVGNGGIVMNMDTGEVYFGKNIHRQNSMASIAKIMTCVLALENLEMTDRTLPVISSDLVGGSSMGLVRGESVTVLDAIYGLMLPSGCDAAQVLARTVAGDYASFVTMMNDKAEELGMTSTRYSNASGITDKDNYTTVYDTTKLMVYAMENDIFRTVISTQTYKVEADSQGARAHNLKNTNELLWSYDGCIGGKTGTTTASGAHLIAVAQRHGSTLVAMILGSDTANRYKDTEKLLNYGFGCAPDHIYDSVVTAPDCTGQGYTTHTCVCGEQFVDSWVDAAGHSWGAWEEISAVLRQRTCTVCGGTEQEEIAKPEILYGDANADGGINSLDLIVLRQYLAGWDVVLETAAADVNGDGNINSLDLIILRQYLAGWDVTLGPTTP